MGDAFRRAGLQLSKGRSEYGVNRVVGLIGVSNNFTVKPQVPPANVRDQIIKALERAAPFDVNDVTIRVDGGKVSLSGHLETIYERDIVRGIAWAAPGITEVIDKIDITWNY